MRKKQKAQQLSLLGLKLAKDEHEQKDGEMHQLLEAQLKLER